MLDPTSQAAIRRARDALAIADPGEAPPRPDAMLGLSTKELRQYSIIRGALEVANRQQPRMSVGGGSISERLDDMYRPAARSFEDELSRALAAKLGRELLPGRMLVPLDVLARDMTAAGVSGSAYLVGTSNAGFIPALRAASVVSKLGATVVGPLKDNSTFPKSATGCSTTWLSTESTPITESAPTIGQVAATPKVVGALFDLSHQLVKQISPEGEALLLADIGGAIAAAVDTAALAGTGNSGQPTGLLATAGVGTFTGTSLDLAALTNAQTDVSTGNAVLNENALGYVTTPAVAALLKARQRFTGSSTALWEGSLHHGTVEGAPAYSTSAMTAATMAFGDWSNLMLLELGVLELMVDPFSQFNTGVHSMRALWQVDVAVRTAAGFSIATSIT